MPLTRNDYLSIASEIRRLLTERDPGSLEPIVRDTGSFDDPKQYVLALLKTTARFYTERSSEMNASVLDRINHFVRLEDGSPVRGLSVVLSPQDQELYGRFEVSLAELPDRSAFVNELIRIEEEIRLDSNAEGSQT